MQIYYILLHQGFWNSIQDYQKENLAMSQEGKSGASAQRASLELISIQASLGVKIPWRKFSSFYSISICLLFLL